MKQKAKIGALALGVLCGVMPLGGCDGGSGGGMNNNQPEITYDLTMEDIPFRDICILPDSKTKTYYMIGFTMGVGSAQSVDCYQSKDLENWGGFTTVMPNDGAWEQSWAPEVHEYKGEYYLFANLRGRLSEGDYRGCYILKSDKPNGVYEMHSERITSKKWECLDGTLYVEDGIPYMVYCREWTRIISGNGEMYYVRLKDDLSGVYPGAEHVKLFAARDHTASSDGVTDGCWMYTANNGDLVMLWSKYIDGKYAVISSRSVSGKIGGEWTHDPEPLFTNDGGHAMLFKDFNGDLRIAFHERSTTSDTLPVIYYLEDDNGNLRIVNK